MALHVRYYFLMPSGGIPGPASPTGIVCFSCSLEPLLMPHVIGSTALCASALLLYLCCLLNNTLLMPTVCQALPQALGTQMDGTALPLGSSQSNWGY